MKKPLNLAGQSTGSLAEFSFSSESSDDNDNQFLEAEPEDEAAGDDQKSWTETDPPSPPHRSLPPDSPQLLVFILLWVVAIGCLIIAKVMPQMDLPNQAAHWDYGKRVKEWNSQGYPLFNTTTATIITNNSRSELSVVDHASSLRQYTAHFFTGTIKYRLQKDRVSIGGVDLLSLQLGNLGKNSKLTWPATIFRSTVLENITDASGCNATKAQWDGGHCTMYEGLVALSAVVDMTNDQWCWAADLDRQTENCQRSAPRELTAHSYRPVPVGNSSTLVTSALVVVRHRLDPHLLAATLPFQLTAEQKKTVSKATERFSYGLGGLAIASTVLIVCLRYALARDM